MVDKDDLGGELGTNVSDEALLGNSSVQWDLLDSIDHIAPAGAKAGSVFDSLCTFLGQAVLLLLGQIVSDFILLLITRLNLTGSSRAGDHVSWRAHVFQKECGLSVDSLVVLPIKDVEELVSVVLVCCDNLENVFLNLCIWDAALKGTLLRVESGANGICNLRDIDDFAVGALRKNLGNQGFTTKGLAKDDAPLGAIAEVLLESALIPGSHSLQTVLLLEKGVD